MVDKKTIIAAGTAAAAATGAAVVAGKKILDGRKKTSEGSGSSRGSVDTASGNASATDGSVTYHVKPDGDRWSVEAENAKQAASTHATKKEALTAARALAHRRTPSHLIIHRANGTIQDQHSYGD